MILKTTQIYRDAVSSGERGLVVVWQHYFRQKLYFDNMYAQLVDSTDNVGCGEYGVGMCAGHSSEKSLWFVGDGQGSVVAVWEDEPDIDSVLYVQRINGAGQAYS